MCVATAVPGRRSSECAEDCVSSAGQKQSRERAATRSCQLEAAAIELEAALNAHPAVLESAAFGVPSDLGEEEVKVVVVFRPGRQASFEELTAFLGERVARFAVPRYFEPRDALPKTPSERVQKHLLKAEGVTAATWDRERGR